MGFATFPARSLPFVRRLRAGGLPSPLRLTLRSFSLRDSPVRVTAPYALSPLFEASGPRSARVATIVSESFHRSLDLKALLHREVRCRPASVATDGLPDAPLGLVPYLVLNAWSGLDGSIGPEGILVPSDALAGPEGPAPASRLAGRPKAAAWPDASLCRHPKVLAP